MSWGDLSADIEKLLPLIRQLHEKIRKQVEALFKVNVIDVRTARVLGKTKRVGRNMGRLPLWKKAFVTLKEGDRIDFFGVG